MEGHFPFIQVNFKSAGADGHGGEGACRFLQDLASSENDFDPRNKLPDAERFREVVIRAGFQADAPRVDLLGFGSKGGS